jgi:hypothetical protein
VANEKQPCSECGRSYQVPYLYHHLRRAHGIFGGRSGTLRRDKRSKRQKAAPVVPEVVEPSKALVSTNGHVAAPGAGLKFKVMPFVVLEDQNGGTWLAERLR